MTTGHFQVSTGMDVVGADQERVGPVTEVRDTHFVIDHPQGRAISVPFAAIARVTGTQVVLTLTAAHVETLTWPHQKEVVEEPTAGAGGLQGTLVV